MKTNEHAWAYECSACKQTLDEPMPLEFCCSGFDSYGNPDCGCGGMPIDPPWCSDCYDRIMNKAERIDPENQNFSGRKEIVMDRCPYCNAECDLYVDEPDPHCKYQHECGECEKVFVYALDFSIDYYPMKADCLNGEPHLWEHRAKSKYQVYDAGKFECATCGERKLDEETKAIWLREHYSELESLGYKKFADDFFAKYKTNQGGE